MPLRDFKLDRAALSVTTLDGPSDEAAYWWGKSPSERLDALEWLRQVNYGYDPATTRLQRVLAIARLEGD